MISSQKPILKRIIDVNSNGIDSFHINFNRNIAHNCCYYYLKIKSDLKNNELDRAVSYFMSLFKYSIKFIDKNFEMEENDLSETFKIPSVTFVTGVEYTDKGNDIVH